MLGLNVAAQTTAGSHYSHLFLTALEVGTAREEPIPRYGGQQRDKGAMSPYPSVRWKQGLQHHSTILHESSCYQVAGVGTSCPGAPSDSEYRHLSTQQGSGMALPLWQQRPHSHRVPGLSVSGTLLQTIQTGIKLVNCLHGGNHFLTFHAIKLQCNHLTLLVFISIPTN